MAGETEWGRGKVGLLAIIARQWISDCTIKAGQRSDDFPLLTMHGDAVDRAEQAVLAGIDWGGDGEGEAVITFGDDEDVPVGGLGGNFFGESDFAGGSGQVARWGCGLIADGTAREPFAAGPGLIRKTVLNGDVLDGDARMMLDGYRNGSGVGQGGHR